MFVKYILIISIHSYFLSTLPGVPYSISLPISYPLFTHFWLSLITLWASLVLPVCAWVCENPLGRDQSTSDHIPKREWFSLPQQPSIANSYSDREPLSQPCWHFDELDLVRATTDACEQMSVTAMSHLKVSIPQLSSSSANFYTLSTKSPEPWMEVSW